MVIKVQQATTNSTQATMLSNTSRSLANTSRGLNNEPEMPQIAYDNTVQKIEQNTGVNLKDPGLFPKWYEFTPSYYGDEKTLSNGSVAKNFSEAYTFHRDRNNGKETTLSLTAWKAEVTTDKGTFIIIKITPKDVDKHKNLDVYLDYTDNLGHKSGQQGIPNDSPLYLVYRKDQRYRDSTRLSLEVRQSSAVDAYFKSGGSYWLTFDKFKNGKRE